jgi:hypothetical protein
MAKKKGIWNRFNIPKKEFEDEIIKPLQRQNVDLQTIDLMACDTQNDIEGIKEYIRQEYGISLVRALSQADVEAREQQRLQNEYNEIRRNVEEQQNLFERLASSSLRRIGNKDKILKEIIDFAPYTEQYTVSTLLAVAFKQSVINYSEAGTSKSRSTLELLNLLNIPFNVIGGHQTAKHFFLTLKAFNGSIIVIDESAELLSNTEVRNLLLPALQKQVVRWETDREQDEFQSESTIIFNTNHLPRTSVMRAVADRCFTNIVSLNPDKVVTKIASLKTYSPDMETWECIKNNLFVEEELTEKEKSAVFDIIKLSRPKSVRFAQKCNFIANLSLRLLGTMELLKYFVSIDNIDFILNNPELKRSEKVKLIAKERKVSERHARRIIGQGRKK